MKDTQEDPAHDRQRAWAREVAKARQMIEYCDENGLLVDKFGPGDLRIAVQDTIAALMKLASELEPDPLSTLTGAFQEFVSQQAQVAREKTPDPWYRNPGTTVIMVHVGETAETGATAHGRITDDHNGVLDQIRALLAPAGTSPPSLTRWPVSERP